MGFIISTKKDTFLSRLCILSVSRTTQILQINFHECFKFEMGKPKGLIGHRDFCIRPGGHLQN